MPHPDLVWQSAELLEDYEKNSLKIKTDDGQVNTDIIIWFNELHVNTWFN